MLKNTKGYGTWMVKTENDVEGRTIRHLGTFTGYIDEIALYLANKCYYTLDFKRVEDITVFKPTKSSVSVRVNDFEDIKQISKLLEDRPIKIKDGNYYKSVIISPINKKDVEQNIAKEKALSKLNEEDKKALGL